MTRDLSKEERDMIERYLARYIQQTSGLDYAHLPIGAPIVETVERVVGYAMDCEVCGVRFVAKRPDAKTCSGACRVKLHRKKG